MSVHLEGIHEKVTAGVPTATRDLFLAVLGPLSGFLRNTFPSLTDDDRHDLAVDAVLEYLGNPGKYDPSRSSLWSFVCLIAKRNASDFMRKGARRRQLLDERVQSDVEFWASRAKDEHNGEDEMDARHIMALHGGRLAINIEEASALRLLLTDEKDTAAYADAMGIDPAAADTEAVVKKTKDRLLLRLKRLRDEL